MLRRVIVRLIICLLLACTAAVGAPIRPSETDASGLAAVTGTAGPSAVGVRVDPRRVSAPAGEALQPLQRRYPVDDGTFGRLKMRTNAAAAARDTAAGLGLGPVSTANFPTLATGDAGGWNPPDAGLAVGPSTLAASILVAVNEGFAVYDRAGTRHLPSSGGSVGFDGFFRTSGSTFDPRALYDASQGHFVLLATTGGVYALATSLTQDPTGEWCTYLLPSDSSGVTSADFPGLGMDGANLYITSNQFSISSGSFQYAQLLVVPKASVYRAPPAMTCPTATSTLFADLQNPGGGVSFTVQPINQPDAVPGESGSMYLVNAIWSSGSNLAVRTVSNTSAGPVLNPPAWVSAGSGSNGFIGSYNLPADAPQPRGAAIDTGDTRLLGGVERFGQIYTSNTTLNVDGRLSSTPNPYANAQWYVLTPAPTASSPSATTGQTWAITNRSVAYFFPAVLPGCTTQLAGTGCPTPYVALEISGSGRGQPASAFAVKNGQPSLYQLGVSGYTLSSRWGDYAAVASDPSTSTQIWVMGEYARSTTSWGMAVAPVTTP